MFEITYVHTYIYKEAYLWGGKGLSLHQFFRSTIFFATPLRHLFRYPPFTIHIYHYNFILINELKKRCENTVRPRNVAFLTADLDQS